MASLDSSVGGLLKDAICNTMEWTLTNTAAAGDTVWLTPWSLASGLLNPYFLQFWGFESYIRSLDTLALSTLQQNYYAFCCSGSSILSSDSDIGGWRVIFDRVGLP